MGSQLQDFLQEIRARKESQSQKKNLPSQGEAPSDLSIVQIANKRKLDRQKKTNESRDKKLYEFYGITEEDKVNAHKESGSLITDIADFLDNLNRPFYGVTAAAKKTIELSKEPYSSDPSKSAFEKEIASKKSQLDATWRGLTLEEKTDARDLMRLIVPEALDTIEKNTTFKPLGFLGVDSITMDAASVPLFMAEIAMDPLTYVPFGAPVSMLKSILKKGGSGTRAVASKIVGKEVIDKQVEKIADLYATKVAPYTNIKHAAKKYNSLEEAFDSYKVATDLANSRPVSLAQDAMTTGEKMTLLGKMKTFATKEQGELLDKTNRELEDKMVDIIGEKVAKEAGLSLKEYTQLSDLKSILNDINMNQVEGNSKAASDLLNQFNQKLGDVKNKKLLSYIKKGVLEGKHLKGFAKELASTEYAHTVAFAEANLKIARDARKIANKEVARKLGILNKVEREEFKLSSKLLDSEINDVSNGLKAFQTEFDGIIRGEVNPAMLERVQTVFSNLKEKISSLDKFQLEEIKGIGKNARKSAAIATTVKAPLRKVVSEISKLEQAIGRSQMAIIRKEGASLLDDVSLSIKNINKSLNTFKSYRGSVVNRLGKYVKDSGKLNLQIVDKVNAEKKILFDQMKSVEQNFAMELVKKEVVVRKMKDKFRADSKQYYKILKSFNDGAYHQKIISGLAKEREALIQSAAKGLPEELRRPFFKIREIYDDYRKRLMETDDPLLKFGNPLYAGPRQIAGDEYKKLQGVYAKSGGLGTNLKHRKIGKNTEFYKFVEEQSKLLGRKFEMDHDAPMLLMAYSKRMELKIAKHNLEQAAFRELGVKSLKELSKKDNMLAKSMQYLFENGATRYNNPVLEFLYNGTYGKGLNIVKSALTVFNPGFVVRNVLGMPFLAATTAGTKYGLALSPVNFYEALKMKMGKSGFITAKGGKKISTEAFLEAAEKTGYYSAGQIRGDFKQSANMLLNRYPKTSPMHWIGQVFKFNAHVEDLGRSAAAIANWKTGKYTIEEALARGKTSMFDYNLINSPVDKALQGIFGFYTFSRRNLPREVMGILSDPARYAMTVRTLDKVANRERLSQEEIDSLNNYEKSTFKLYGDVIDGVRKFTTLGFTPTEEAYQTLNSITSGDLKKLLGSRINPLVGSFLDFYYGESSFTGEEFGNFLPSRYEALIPEKLQKALKLTVKERPKLRAGEVVGTEKVLYGNPNTIFAIRNIPIQSRFLSDLTQLVEGVKEGEPVEAVAGYLSIKTKKLDLEARKKQRERKTKEILMKKAKSRGASETKNYYIPKWQKEK